MSVLDQMIRKLEGELEERKSAYEAILSHADKEGREPTESEQSTMNELTNRMSEIGKQLEGYDKTDQIVQDFTSRARELDTAIQTRRALPNGVEYRTAGEYIVEMWRGATGDREASARLELFHRAAAHQKTGDNLGVVPDPIVGSVIDFIDAARPIVSVLGPQPLPSATFYRPIVTQRPTVAVQGTAGAAGDEKAELVSQKMLISRLTLTAVTYGGYVNVSRQNIDFSSPQIMDIVINGLAAQYAIETEEATGVELDSSTATAVGYGASPTATTIRAALWAAAGDIYAATKGQGRVVLALAPDRLEVFGPLFTPIPLSVGPGEGLTAGDFGSGVVGAISGIPVVMSAGLASGKAFLFSTAAVEAWEQRVGSLQAVEPSVLGVQVAYAGYFTPSIIVDGGVIELTAT